MKNFKKLLVTGCSFSAGFSDVNEARTNPSTWSHYLVKDYLTDINVLINVALTGGGNTAASENLVYAIETQTVIDPKDTLIIFNITGLQRIDMITYIDHNDANENNSWAKPFNFSYINVPHLSSIGTCFKDTIHKNCGWENVILQNSLRIQMLMSYLNEKKFEYYFMIMDNTIEERAPNFLITTLKNSIKFEGLNMHEYCKENDLLANDSFHPNDKGYQQLSDIIFKHISQ